MSPKDNAETELLLLRRRLERERRARQEAETIAEQGLRDLFERRREIELLEAIAVASNLATRIDDVMRLALDQICAYTQWPIGHVYLFVADPADTAGELVSSRIWHFDDEERFAEFRDISEQIHFSAGIGLPGRIFASGKPAWISNIALDPNFPRGPRAVEAGLRSAFGFPVLVGTEVAAVLEFFSPRDAEPDERLLTIMAQIGTQLGRVVERKQAEDRLIHDAFHDSLTTLANRALFLERLQGVLNQARRSSDYRFAVLFLDLDRFKTINDSLGHVAGDRLIVEAAERLVTSVRRTDARDDIVARIGGDEFTIILDNIRDVSDPIRVADRIQRALAAPFVLAGQKVFTTASIGIALSSTGYQTVHEVLRDADIAMYRAKALGRARWEVFDEVMREQAVANLQLEAELHHALQDGQLRVHYQPIVALDDGRIRGFEALVRWQHPSKGLVLPGRFIPLAEEIGLIRPLGRWVLAEACRQLRIWQDRFPFDPPLTMSVNLSAKELEQADLIEHVARTVAESGIAYGSLKLELTESALMGDVERADRLFAEFQQLGIALSLDDFGTGYSSLSRLRRLPIDTLKIDRSFVKQMEADGESRQIVEIILQLARALELEVIAEGAETAGEIDLLRSFGCQHVQGFYFFEPRDSTSVEAILKKLGR